MAYEHRALEKSQFFAWEVWISSIFSSFCHRRDHVLFMFMHGNEESTEERMTLKKSWLLVLHKYSPIRGKWQMENASSIKSESNPSLSFFYSLNTVSHRAFKYPFWDDECEHLCRCFGVFSLRMMKNQTCKMRYACRCRIRSCKYIIF